MKHCLVVGDSRVIRTVACRILADMKFYAEEAEEGATALEACRMQMPDVVLVDLANKSGPEFMRALRRSKSDKAPIVLFATTENDADHIGEALYAGADEYLMKPFDRASIEAKFAQVGLA